MRLRIANTMPCWAAMAAVVAGAPVAAQVGPVTVRPRDTGEALCNPGMGWTLHYYSNIPTNYGSRLAPSDTVDEFPGLTTIYLRIPWSYIEPEEGIFNWSVVDGPAQRWVRLGKQVAFRFSCSESWMRYATPKWVEDAGAKGYDFRPGEGIVEDGPFWEPDYNDPVFLDKLDNFLAAAAARYDGRPEVAFIDVGSFGVWGEGHLFASTRMEYPPETIVKHIDMHLKHFRDTLLAANDDFSFFGDEIIDYARGKGLTLRDDSILVQPGENAYFHAEMAQGFWPNLPVVLECEHYGGSRDRGNWQDGSLYLRAVEEYHASFASIHWWPREFLEGNRELIDRINLRLGYRLQLVEASWPAEVLPESGLTFEAEWRNAGVAPCYRGGFPAVTLRDAEGGLVTVFADESLNVKELPVGPPGEAETVRQEFGIRLPFYVRPGRYDVLVSVGTRTGIPEIALPLPDGDGERRYRLGELVVRGQFGVGAGDLTREGEQWLLPLTFTIHEPLPDGTAPYIHCDSAGRIAFMGYPIDDAPRADLLQPGEVTIPVRLEIPGDAPLGAYPVYAGLWLPERVGQPNERLFADSGEQDRRTLLGTLTIGEDGGVAWEAASGA